MLHEQYSSRVRRRTQYMLLFYTETMTKETTEHLILYCNFARQVWEKMTDWTQQRVQPPQNG